MTEITVEPAGTGKFRVTIREGESETRHVVTVGDTEHDGGSEQGLVEASFRFLLDREPKESILSHFDLSVIERYFPEYPERIGDYL
jgi:hypothetical protein